MFVGDYHARASPSVSQVGLHLCYRLAALSLQLVGTGDGVCLLVRDATQPRAPVVLWSPRGISNELDLRWLP